MSNPIHLQFTAPATALCGVMYPQQTTNNRSLVTCHNCKALMSKETEKILAHDPVHRPAHYNQGGMEVIEIIEAFAPESNAHLFANVVKYVLRAPRKGNAKQDLEKARWYLDRWISKL